MNAGEDGMTTADRVALIVFGVGFLLIRLGAHLARAVDDNLWTESNAD